MGHPAVVVTASSSGVVTSPPYAPFDMDFRNGAKEDRKSLFLKTVNPGRDCFPDRGSRGPESQSRLTRLITKRTNTSSRFSRASRFPCDIRDTASSMKLIAISVENGTFLFTQGLLFLFTCGAYRASCVRRSFSSACRFIFSACALLPSSTIKGSGHALQG
jgi:hypothetical protein